MPAVKRSAYARILILAATFVFLTAPTGASTDARTNGSDACPSGESFDGTFDAIQALIFENRSCTAGPCHGSSASGGLDLRDGASYANLFDVPSQGSSLLLVHPGDRKRSYLYSKLAAATFPGSVEIAGAPMPNGLAPLTLDELDLLRLWITSGAPETGTVEGTEDLIDGCLPEPEPITIEPLTPPAEGEGVQFVMPPWDLAAEDEDEVCFATYYDFTGTIPEQFLNEDGTSFRFNVMELRQDPQSHHLLLHYTPNLDLNPHDPAFGEWTCAGGPTPGQACDPVDLGACGNGGLCRTAPASGAACIGWGPGQAASRWSQIGGAQQAIALLPFSDGVYADFPLKGVLRWNSHAFNLTKIDAEINGRLNYTFAANQQHLVRRIFNANQIFKANAAPFTTEEVCHSHVLPRGSRLFSLTSHTHQRGKRFRVWNGDFTCDGGPNAGQPCAPSEKLDDAPDLCAGAQCRSVRSLYVGDCNGDTEVGINELITGVNIALNITPLDQCPDFDTNTDNRVAIGELLRAIRTSLDGEPTEIDRDPETTQIYASFQYTDPLYADYEPPLAFNSSDRLERTLTFCSLYNNGVADDGAADLASVTRRSKTPPNSFGPCRAVACVNDGMVGESCQTDRACDSSPGAADGWCDACNITGGVSTENEMFILIGLYWIEP